MDQYEVQQDIYYFPLPGLLPAGYMLALNPRLGTVACLSCSHGLPRMLKEQQFAPAEISMLLPILKSYPNYCPYEMLLACFNNPDVDEVLLVASRERLRQAQRKGTWDQEMRPVRNALSRTRLKFQHLGLDIVSLFETGYMVIPLASVRIEQPEHKLQLVGTHSA